MVETSANLLQCVSKCLYQFYGNYLNSGSLLGMVVLRILPDQCVELQALNPNFMTPYKVMEWSKIFLWGTTMAANGVLSQIPTKLPGINDLSKLKVSAPVTWWYKVVEWSGCAHLSVNQILKITGYIKLKVLWWYMGCLDKPRWCREKCGVH